MASLSLGRTKLRLLSTFMLALGLVVQPFSIVMANTASAMQADVIFTNLSAWDLGQTRSSGHNEIVAGGLRIWTDDASSFAKAAGYYDVVDTGLSGFTDFGLSWTGTTPAPGGQLVVDMNGNGVLDGILVVEPVYGGNQWLASINTADLDLTNAPMVGGGGGTYNGTFAQWLSAYPDSKVSAIGYSLGSGVLGDGVISSITAGGVSYGFDLPTVATIGSTGYYSLQAAFTAATAGQTIVLQDDVTLSQQLTITKAVTLNGNDHTITGAFVKTNNSNNSVIGVQSDNVTITNLTVDAVSGATNLLHGVNIYNSDDVVLTNVIAMNGRSGVVVGLSSTVNASNISTSGNTWHGINVDKPGAHLTISGTNSHNEARQIFVDDKTVGTVIDIENQYSRFEQNGAYTYVLLSDMTDANGSISLPVSGGVATTPTNSPLVLSGAQATAVIPEGTTISSNPAWNGTIDAPTITSFIVPGTVDTTLAITVGSSTYSLVFDHAVQLQLPGQGGKRVGFQAPGGNFTEITAVCTTFDPVQADAQLAAAGANECKMSFEGNLYIWTNHFTIFATFTPQPVSQGSGTTSSTSTTRSGNFFSPTVYDDTWMEGANTEEGETYGNVKSNNVGLSGIATVNDNLQEVPTKGISWYWWLLGGVLAAGAWSLVSLLRSGRFNR